MFEVVELIGSKDRQIREKALEVLDDIIYFCIRLSVPLLEKAGLLDLLQKVLLDELAIADSNTTPIVAIISHMLNTLTQLEGKA